MVYYGETGINIMKIVDKIFNLKTYNKSMRYDNLLIWWIYFNKIFYFILFLLIKFDSFIRLKTFMHLNKGNLI